MAESNKVFVHFVQLIMARTHTLDKYRNIGIIPY